MKTHSPALIELLNSSSQFLMADLYTITTVQGEVLRYTSTDTSISHAGHTYSAHGPLIKRGQVRTVIGLEVDTLSLTVAAKAEHTLGGRPFLAAALSGALDGASVLLQRAFLSAWAEPPVGAVVLFKGRVSEMDGTRTQLRVTVKSELELLNTKLPRNLYQAGCSHTLFDAGCAASKAAHTTAGTVTAADPDGRWVDTTITSVAGGSAAFLQGVLLFSGGRSVGLQRTIKTFDAGRFTFALPLDVTPDVGDTCSATKGCDKTQATCSARFNNLIRFGGFPFIPVPETAT